MIVVATDAPVDSRNLSRLAARTMMGLGRTGSAGSNDEMSRLFLAAIEATEEAIYNSLFKGKTTKGCGRTVEAFPIEKTITILKKYQAIK